MPTPVGFADCSVFLAHPQDPDEWAITFGVETDLASASVDDHAAKVFGDTANAWASMTYDTMTWTRAVLRFGQDGGDDLVAEYGLTPVDGTSTTDKLPQNCAALVRKVTGVGGRKHRGRNFIPGVLSEEHVSNVGVIASSHLGNLQDCADDWLDNLADTGGGTFPSTPMVILHSDGSPPTPVQSLVVDNVIATQRRRLRR